VCDYLILCVLSVCSVGAKPKQHNFLPSGECLEDRAERQQAGEWNRHLRHKASRSINILD